MIQWVCKLENGPLPNRIMTCVNILWPTMPPRGQKALLNVIIHYLGINWIYQNVSLLRTPAGAGPDPSLSLIALGHGISDGSLIQFVL